MKILQGNLNALVGILTVVMFAGLATNKSTAAVYSVNVPQGISTIANNLRQGAWTPRMPTLVAVSMALKRFGARVRSDLFADWSRRPSTNCEM